MSIKLTEGNILQSNAEAIVNTVNCVGVMGKGLALQFKQAFPENFKQYAKACKKSEVQPGKMNIFTTGTQEKPFYIINFPTKTHWKSKSKIEFIQAGLDDLVHIAKEYSIQSIAIPPLGCGLGGLNWHDIEPLIIRAFDQIPDVKILLYPPQSSPKAKDMPIRTAKPPINRLSALLIKLMEQYQLPGYLLSLLEIQKIAYFLQASGEDLKLEFVKHKYGPYAEPLNYVLQRIEGHYIRGYGDRSQEGEISLLDGAVEAANQFLETHKNAEHSLNRVKSLLEGFETPYSVELLATAHWVSCYEEAKTLDDVIQKIHSWNDRKRRLMQSNHIEKAYNRLVEQNWIG